jgi:hypothetical protein
MLRLTLAGALAAGALLAPAAHAQDLIQKCTDADPCYECVMYPCQPGEWQEFLIARACDTARVCDAG